MALKLYEEIHQAHPNDIECVRYLITICKEMKQKYDHYASHLRKLERMQEQGAGGGGGQQQDDDDAIGGSAMGGRVQRPGSFDPGDDDEPDQSPRAMELYQAEEPELPSRAAPKRRLAAAKREEEDDDWGDNDLDMLPGM